MTQEDVPLLAMAVPVHHRGSNLSVRRGTRWLGVTAVRLPLPEGGTSAPVPLVTRSLPFQQLTDADLADEHDPACRTLEGLLRVLQTHYPGFSAQEMVTLCRYHWAD